MKIVIIRWSVRVNRTSSIHRKCMHTTWTEWSKSPGQLRISGSFYEWRNEGKWTSIVWSAICLGERQCLFDCSLRGPKIQVQCQGINSLRHRGPSCQRSNEWEGVLGVRGEMGSRCVLGSNREIPCKEHHEAADCFKFYLTFDPNHEICLWRYSILPGIQLAAKGK